MNHHRVVAKILSDARDRVRAGWTQGEAISSDSQRVCSAQALQASFTHLQLHPYLVDETREVMQGHDMAYAYRDANIIFAKAMDELTGKEWRLSIPEWNDWPGRTQDEVVHTFDHAIKIVERDAA